MFPCFSYMYIIHTYYLSLNCTLFVIIKVGLTFDFKVEKFIGRCFCCLKYSKLYRNDNSNNNNKIVCLRSQHLNDKYYGMTYFSVLSIYNRLNVVSELAICQKFPDSKIAIQIIMTIQSWLKGKIVCSFIF